jgi:adenylate cyclase
LWSVAVGAVVLAASMSAGGVLDEIELQTIDARFGVRGPREPPPDLLVVAIDDVTFDELNLQWPFPRRLHAQIIDRLAADGAGAIVYDVQFTEPTDVANDNALIDAVTRADTIVLAATETDEQGRTNVFGGGKALAATGAHVGNTLVKPDSDGVIRRIVRSIGGLETMAFVVAKAVSGRRITPKRSGSWIDFAGPPGRVETISLSELLDGRVGASRIRGSVVVVGATAPSLGDVHATAAEGSEPMSGAEIQANAIATVLAGFSLESPARGVNMALILVLGLGVSLLARLPRLWVAVTAGLVALAAFLGAAQLAFQTGVILDVVYPLTAGAVGLVGTLFARALITTAERARLRLLFGRFVADDVVGEALEHIDEGGAIPGAESSGTIMFLDLRGFTPFAEASSPREVINLLNHRLGAYSEIIDDQQGTVISYLGDGLLAVFGAPRSLADHADRALAAATAILDLAPALPLGSSDEPDQAKDLAVRIGLHSGEFVAGTVGSSRRLEYTIVGDAVNVAARVQEMAKAYGVQLLMSDAHHSALSGDADGQLVGEATVRGRQQPIRLWTLPERRPRQ